MIQLKITSTGKGYNPKSQWETFNVTTEPFNNINAAKEYLKDTYGKCKRVKMYCDPDASHIGYIYSFRNADMSHYPVNKWIQQDWVEFRDSKPIKLS